MRTREGTKYLRWVTKEHEKKAIRSSSLCPSGGVRVVYQNHEDEKNSPEFFEAY